MRRFRELIVAPATPLLPRFAPPLCRTASAGTLFANPWGVHGRLFQTGTGHRPMRRG